MAKANIPKFNSILHKKQLEALAKFIGAESIEYRDFGGGESLIITKIIDGERVVVTLRATNVPMQGGLIFMSEPRIIPKE